MDYGPVYTGAAAILTTGRGRNTFDGVMPQPFVCLEK